MKIIARNQLNEEIINIKAAGKKLVFTNGCFDILHVGHVRYLNAARKLGDCLIVGLNSDSSVRCLKGPTRPINNQDDRAEVLAGLSSVDYVVVFDERTAENLIAEIKPAIYVKGGDYQIEELPEAQVVKQYGGHIELIPEVPGRSSSNVIKKIRNDS